MELDFRTRMRHLRPDQDHDSSALTFAELAAASDEELVACMKNGHGDALAVLFDRYHRLVFSIALKILRDIGEAEDVMQNVFLEIYRVAGQFDASRGTSKVWILQYAYHRSMNRRQQLANRRFYATVDIAEVEDHLVGSNMAARQESARLVKQALDTLNSAQKHVLDSAYFEGRSLKEIAEETGESLGNVRHHYYRGLAKLRTFLTEADEPQVSCARTEVANART